MNPKDIEKLIPRWRNKIYAHPSAVDVEGTVKLHRLVLRVIGQDRSLHIHPLSDEIS